MRKRIASILLGEDVDAILNKIKLYNDEVEDIKSQLKTLLKKKHSLGQEINKDNNQYALLRCQIEDLKKEIEQKRVYCDILKELDLLDLRITNSKTRRDSISLEISNICKFLDNTIAKKENLLHNLSETKQNIATKSRVISYSPKPENSDAIDQEIKEHQEWINSHIVELLRIEQEIDTQIELWDVRETFIKIVNYLIDINKQLIQIVLKKKELSTEIVKLNKDLASINQSSNNLRKQKEAVNEKIEKKRYNHSEDDNSLLLRSINDEISIEQKWLREHSGELTLLQKEIDALIDSVGAETPPNPSHSISPLPNQGIQADTREKKEPRNLEEAKPKGQASNSVEGPRKNRNRVIKEIYDLETGNTINADDFFQKPMDELIKSRDTFQEYINKDIRRFVCPICFEMIRISGRGDERGIPSIFTHKNDSVYCQRTTTGRSAKEINRIKYGRYGQSLRHKILKELLSNFLRDKNSVALGVQNVEIEKRVNSAIPFFNWRQPDVQIEYQGKKIVFEIQLSTTFLSVIKERNTFYRLNGYYIIWVFNFDDNNKYVDLNNLAMKDIYFANKMNAFIFDDEAKKWSSERSQLVLKCNWLDADSCWHYPNTEERFGGVPITLDQLIFDTKTFKPYFYDAEAPYYEAHPENAKLFMEEQTTIEDYIKDLENKQKESDIKKQEAIEKMMENGDSVISYKDGNKYGFKYGVTQMIEPRFTTCERREDGTYIVGFNRKKGLVSQYGEVLRDCKYINIHPLPGSAYLAEDKDSFWICNIDEQFYPRLAGDIVKCQNIGNRIDKVELFHRDSHTAFSTFYIIDGCKLIAKIQKVYSFVNTFGVKIIDDDFYSWVLNHGEETILVQRIADLKWNIIDYDGIFLSEEWTTNRPPIPISHNRFIVYNGDLCGVQDSEGEIIIPISHKEIQAHPTLIYTIIKDSIRERSSYSYTYNDYNQFTLLGINGKQDDIPDYLKIPQSSMKFVGDKTLLYGKKIVRLSDFEILNDGYTDAEECYDGNIIVKNGGRVGLISGTGSPIIPCEYISFEAWGDGLYLCKTRKSYSYSYSSYYDEYDLIDNTGKKIESGFSSVDPIKNGTAKVIMSYHEGQIDAKGNLIPDEVIQLSEVLIGRKILGYWEIINKEGKIIKERKDRIDYIERLSNGYTIIRHNRLGHDIKLYGLINDKGGGVLSCQYKSISLWASDIYLICEHVRESIDQEPAYKLVDNRGHDLTEKYHYIGELEGNKAMIKFRNIVGYLDKNAHPIIDSEIPLADGCIKFTFMKKWGIRSSSGEEIIPCNKFTEITTYQGCYAGILYNKYEEGYVVCKTEHKTNNIIPVKGTKSDTTTNSIVYIVGGCGFLVSKNIADKKWGNNIPNTVNLIITNICKPYDPGFRGWRSRYTQVVIAKPYDSSKNKTKNYRNVENGEIIKGRIVWMQYGSAIIKLSDGSTVFVHKSYLKSASIGKKYKGTEIEIKKIGFDEIRQKDKWEVVNVYKENDKRD